MNNIQIQGSFILKELCCDCIEGGNSFMWLGVHVAAQVMD